VVPLGVDTQAFQPVDLEQRSRVRQQLGLPTDHLVIGSFQKDGQGWGAGLEPKLIKGPDIFCDAVIELQRQLPVAVLLTGPARGYVRRRLAAAGVPVVHRQLEDYLDIVSFYHALDLYLITSRIEGGPKSLLESWATGVPVVSSDMGMAHDILTSEHDGFLVPVGDVAATVMAIQRIAADATLAAQFRTHGLHTVQRYDWQTIAHRYVQELYQPLLNN